MWNAELTILYGGRREKFEVSKQSLSIGRSPDNDIVLQDPAVSSRHCEIKFTEEKFYIIDKESSNGTWLNGREVSKAELLPADRVGIGDTTLIFTQKARPKPSLKSGSFGKLSPSLIFPAPLTKGGTRGIGGGNRWGRIQLCSRSLSFLTKLNIRILVVLILVLGTVFIFLGRVVGRPRKVLLDTAILEIDMVEESGGSKELRRSQISISAGLLHFYYDDLGRRRHLYREANLSGEEINELQKKVMNSGLFEISVINHSNSEGEGLLTVSARLNSYDRKVSFSGDLPEGIASFKEELELLVDRRFDFPSLLFSGEELVEKAEKAFARGKLFYDERERRSDNLFNSVGAFKEALWYLEAVEPKPAFLSTVEECLYRSQEELTDEFKKLRFQAEKAMRLSEWDDARTNLEEILVRIPDKTDERYKYGVKCLGKVREKCR